MNAIEINHTAKHHDDVQVLDDVSFGVKQGEVFGPIGPDSVGKISLFRITTLLLLADAGTISVRGYGVVNQYKEIRQWAGYMPGKFSLCQDLTVEESPQFFTNLFNTTITTGCDGIRTICSQIKPFRNRKTGALSGNMKQKLALPYTPVRRPDVLFLDKPTTDIDPVSCKELWQVLGMLREKSIIIVTAAPCLDETRYYEWVAFLNSGRVGAIGGPDEILIQLAEIFNPEGLEHEGRSAWVWQGIAEKGQQERAEDVIQVEHLVKTFRTFHAADDISFGAHRGEIFGFLGANDARRTTTIHMLTGLNELTGGRGKMVRFSTCKHSKQVKEHIGHMSQRFSLYEDMTVAQNIRLFGGIYGMSK